MSGSGIDEIYSPPSLTLPLKASDYCSRFCVPDVEVSRIVALCICERPLPSAEELSLWRKLQINDLFDWERVERFTGEALAT